MFAPLYKSKTILEYLEKLFMGSSGQLKSCIIDLIKFNKFIKLINKLMLKVLKNIYVFLVIPIINNIFLTTNCF